VFKGPENHAEDLGEPMRILFLGNNWVGWKALSYLRTCKENICGLVVHAEPKRRYGKEILESGGVESSRIFVGSELRTQGILEAIKRLEPDIGVSVLFDHILREEFIRIFPKGIVNLHPSYLPYNRGQYPNVWSIVEGTPAGVTLHYIDEGVDTGDIIAQEEVPVALTDTGRSLYRKLENAAIELFKQQWPLIREEKESRVSQSAGDGTFHRTTDVDAIDEIDLEKKYLAKDLINILRARTFPPYSGAYFRVDNERVFLRLELLREGELGERK
jgi:methionyl-tRNA formyltransferase